MHQAQEEDDAAAGDSDSDDAPRNTGLWISDCFEKRSKNLAALPTYNDEKWPQENTHYYRRKKKTEHYVRTDKYTLKCIYQLCKKLPAEAKLRTLHFVCLWKPKLNNTRGAVQVNFISVRGFRGF